MTTNDDEAIPQTHYARSGDVDIAYQVVGNGPIDLVVVPGWISNVEVYWEQPDWARFTRRLASFARVILFDKRGTGLSDRVSELPSLEVRMDDVRAVMDAVGSSKAALFGWSEGGPMCALFAATYPHRVVALIMSSSYARRRWAPDHAWARTEAEFEASLKVVAEHWGTPRAGMASRCASRVGDRAFEAFWGRLLRMSATPNAAIALMRMNDVVDIRHVLPVVSVPTLVLHPTRDPLLPVDDGRYLARHIPGARLVEIDSNDHVPFLSTADRHLEEIERFLTGTHHADIEIDRVLATIMFTDIVGSTEQAVSHGDRRWVELLREHHRTIRQLLGRFRGKEVDTAGDGFFAAFDGPARAVRCACALREAVRALGLRVRVGIHTGECEVVGDKYAGIAVHTGARVAGLAQPDEVLVSSTVKDLVAGSGLSFTDRGERMLKGIPGSWHLFAASA